MSVTSNNRTYVRTVIWLRWKLWRRRWHRQGPLLRAIGVIGTIIAIPVSILAFLISLGLGITFLPSASPFSVVSVWAVLISLFIYMRIMGMWISLQQDDGLALDKLLHLPISFQSVFSINFSLSQLSFSNLFFLPVMLGFAIACAITLALGNVVFVFTALAVALCVAAILHQFQSWLLMSMVNKRKRMIWAYLLFIGVIGIAQLPNFYFAFAGNQAESAEGQSQTELIVTELVNERVANEERETSNANEVPSDHWTHGWILMHSSTGYALPWWTVATTIGLLGVAFLSFRRSYRMTLARYQDGREVGVNSNVKVVKERQGFGSLRVTQSPIVAVTNVTMKGWVRSTYGKIVLLSPLILVMLLPLLFVRFPTVFEPRLLPLLLVGVVAFIASPAGLVCNLFAFDRLGFRLYLFAGLDIRYVLLGKFIALFMVFFVICAVVFTLASALSPISTLHLLGSVFQAGLVFLGCILLGVVWSARYPYAVSFTSMKAHGGAASVLAFIAEVIFIGLVLWIASRVLAMEVALEKSNHEFPLYLVASIIEFVVALAAGGILLKSLARYVVNRSTHILEAVATPN